MYREKYGLTGAVRYLSARRFSPPIWEVSGEKRRKIAGGSPPRAGRGRSGTLVLVLDPVSRGRIDPALVAEVLGYPAGILRA